MEIIVPILSFIVGAGAAIVTLWTNHIKIRADVETQRKNIERDFKLEEIKLEKQKEIIRLNLEAEYDKDLRQRRIEVYKELWKILQIWEDLSTSENLNNALNFINNFEKKLDNWSHSIGGIFLSEESNKRFEDLRNNLTENALNLYHLDDNKVEITETDELMNMKLNTGSVIFTLKNEMVKDIGTRKTIVLPEPKNSSDLPKPELPKTPDHLLEN